MRGAVAFGVSFLGVTLALAQVEHPVAKISPDQRHDYAELTKVPDRARSRHNPYEADGEAVEAGKKLFERHCAECHGANAAGGKKAPSLSATEVQEATPGTLFWLLTNGVVRRGMPVWSKLPEAQRWQLVRYLRTLKMDSPGDVPALKTDAK